MSDTGLAKMSVRSFKNHPGMLSGLLALHGLNFDSFLGTDSTDRFRVVTESGARKSGARKSGVTQCIGDKKASLIMLARPIWSIPSCRCCSDLKVL